MQSYLHIGGLVAVGFDPTGDYLLVITHSGRGLFDTKTWARVSRDASLAYPECGIGIGIGPIDGQQVPVTVISFDNEHITLTSGDGRIVLNCESDGIAISVIDA